MPTPCHTLPPVANCRRLPPRSPQVLSAARLEFYSATVLYGSHNPYRPLDNAAHNLANMWGAGGRGRWGQLGWCCAAAGRYGAGMRAALGLAVTN